MTKHTPTPWKFQKCYHGLSGQHHIAVVMNDSHSGDKDFDIFADRGEVGQGCANAAFIVRAVNSHDALVDALDAAKAYMENPYPAGDDLSHVLGKVQAALDSLTKEELDALFPVMEV